VLRDDRDRVVPDERRPTGDELVENGADGVKIAPRVGGPPQCLLGRHVRDGPDHHPFLCDPRAVECDGEPEVTEPHASVLVQVDVPRLQVPVDDPAGVGVLERTAELVADPGRFVDRQPVLGCFPDPILEVPSTHVLGDQIELFPVLAHVVDRDDVGVVAETAHRLRLPLDPQPCVRVEPLGLDDRERYVPVETGVPRQVDALLRALAEEALHLVPPRGVGGWQLGFRGGHPGSGSSGLRQARPAPVAEGAIGCVGPVAGRADPRQWFSTARAKGGVGRILTLAGQTVHGAPGYGGAVFYTGERRGPGHLSGRDARGVMSGTSA
jgi:hypothetical protein